METNVKNAWTAKEVEQVTQMIAEGLGNKEIARLTGRSDKAIEHKRAELRSKGIITSFETRLNADEATIRELINDLRKIRDQIYDIEFYLTQSPLYRATHKYPKEAK